MSRSALESQVVRRQRAFIVVLCVATLVSIAGLLASFWIKSPAQLAADQQPPPKSVLTSAVQSKVLVRKVVVRGIVVAGKSVKIDFVGLNGTPAIVTAVDNKAGEQVRAGDTLAQISGRPLVVLSGNVPSYRDLTPGLKGSDVRQLQLNLIRLGFLDRGYDSGVYGDLTKQAVAEFYESKGFEPSMTSDSNTSELAEVAAAKRAVVDTQRKLEGLRADGNPGSAASPTSPELRYATEDLADAQRTLSDLESRAGVQVPFSELAFVGDLPATVTSVAARVGLDLVKAVSPTIMSLDVGGLVVSGVVPEGSQEGLKKGQSVRIDDDVNKRSSIGLLDSVGGFKAEKSDDASGSADQQQSGYSIRVRPKEALGTEWLSAAVRITVTVDSTSKEVLVVPLAAVVSSSDGSTSVSTLRTNGVRNTIAVSTGLVAAGEVEVRPQIPGSLTKGDLQRLRLGPPRLVAGLGG